MQEMRPYTIVTSSETSSSSMDGQEGYPPLILSNGSARLFLSSSGTAATHILCSVKAELGHPSEDNPCEGNIQIHVEDSLGGAALSRRQSQEERNYLQAIISELLAPNLLDLKSLCIMPHHYAFTINIDVEILSGTAGNLIDCCGHTIRAALQNTLLPSIVPSTTAAKSTTSTSAVEKEPTGSTSSDLLLDSDIQHARTPAGIELAPVVVTVTVCQSVSSSTAAGKSFLLLLDATLEEESCSYCQVHVAVDLGEGGDGGTSEPEICSLRKTGAGSLPWALLPDIAALAISAVPIANASFQYSKAITADSLGPLQGQFAIQ